MSNMELTQKQINNYWAKVDVKGPDDCWEWTASKSGGYGQFAIFNKVAKAHRVAVYLDNRDPKEKVVMHTCDNPGCVNPKHLILGTQQDNMQDKQKKNRQACGEAVSRNKLSEAQVLYIRSEFIKGKPGVINSGNTQQLANSFGVTVSTIYDIVRRNNWKHI